MANSSPATVTEIAGRAWIRQPDGSLTELQQGSRIPPQSEVVTASGSSVTLQIDGGAPMTIGENRSVALDGEMIAAVSDPSEARVAPLTGTDSERLLAALESGGDPFDQLDPTAATLSGGGENGGSNFVRLARILEVTTPLDLAYPRPAIPEDELPRLGGVAAGDDEGTDGGTPPIVDPEPEPVFGVITLTSTPSVTEGGNFLVTATVDKPVTGSPLVIELSNGAIIVIPVGQTTGTVEIGTRDDDAYKQGDESVTIGIKGTTGGGFDQLDTSSTTTTVVRDDDDPTAITLTSDNQVTEGGKITVTATVERPVTGSDLVITLTDGSTITIPVGQTTGSVQIDTRDDDAYQQGNDTVTIGIGSTTGGNFEALDTSSTTSTTVVDDQDPVTVTIESKGDVDESQEAVFTISVSEPLDRDLIITLSTGDTVVIPAGSTSVDYTVPAQGDDVYEDAGSITVGLTDASVDGATFEDLVLGPDATVEIADTVDTVTVTIESKGNVNESQDAVFTIRVDTVLDRDLTVTLKNGDTVVIPAGSTSVDYTVPAQGDDVYEDAGAVTVGIADASVDGATFEDLVLGPDATVEIADTVDTVTVTIESKGNVNESQDAVFTIRVDTVLDRDLTVTLKNGDTVVIPAGSTSVDYTVPAQGDDVYEDAGAVTVGIADASVDGATFEDLVLGPDATVEIADTVDTVTVTIESKGNVNESQDAVFTIRVDTVLDRDLTVTLKNGDTVVIPAGSTSVDYTVPAQGDDVYEDAGAVTVGIADASVDGATFEDLVLGPDATVEIADTVDTVTVTIESKGNVNESQDAVFTIRVDTVLDRDLTVTLKNGDTVVIPAGSTSVDYTVPAQGDDVYEDAGSITVGLTDASVDGATFENLVLGPDATVEIADTVDTVTVTIESKGNVNESQDAVFTIRVDTVLDRDLTVTLKNGDTVVIPAGSTSVDYTVPAQGDDVYEDAGSVTVGIADASVDGATFEDLVLGPDATVEIADTVDTVTVTIESKGNVNESQDAVFTIRVDTVLDRDLTVTLKNGDTVVIPAGSTSVDYTVPAQGDDVYEDAGAVTVGIADASVDGATFEDLVLGPDATVEIADTVDTVTVTIESKGNVNESQDAVFTIRVDTVLDRDLTVTLKNGDTVVIPAGSTSVDYTVPAQGDDVYEDAGAVTVGIADASVDGATFEDLVLGPDATVEIADTVDTVTVTIESKGNVNESQDAVFTIRVDTVLDRDLTVTLKNGDTVVIPAGSTSVDYTVPAQGDDVYEDAGAVTVGIADASVDGATFEDLVLGPDATVEIADTVDTVTVTIESKGNVNESQDAVFTIRVDTVLDRDLTVTLKNGDTVVIPAGSTSVDYTVPAQGDDVYEDAGAVTVGIADASVDGATFENLVLGPDATVEITDTVDTVIATLTASGTPTIGSTITYTITLSNAAGLPMDKHGKIVFTLESGETITIEAGQTSASIEVPVTGIGTISDSIVGHAFQGGESFEDFEVAGEINIPVTDGPPTSSGGNVQGTEDTALAISWNDFNISDAETPNGANLGVYITALPADGVLQVKVGGNWVTLTQADLSGDGKYLSKADIDAGLRFVPDANESGADGYGGTGVGNKQGDYAHIQFKPSDGVNIGDEATLVVDIAPVVDAPTITLEIGDTVASDRETVVTITQNGQTIIVIQDGNVTAPGLDGQIKTPPYTDGNLNPGQGGNTQGADVLVLEGDFRKLVNNNAPISSINGGQKDFIYLSGSPSDYALNLGQYDSTGYDGSITQIHQNGSTTTINFNDVRGIIFGDGTTYVDGNVQSSISTTGSDTIEIIVSAELGDTDGSETLSGITLSGIPEGVTIQGATQTGPDTWYIENPTVDQNTGEITVLANVPVNTGSFQITASVTAKESALEGPGSTATADANISVEQYNSTQGTAHTDTLEGSAANDIMIADVAGQKIVVTPGQNYNIALIVDTSGSMQYDLAGNGSVQTNPSDENYNKSRMKLIKDALINLANQLKDHDGVVNISLIAFQTTVSIKADIANLTKDNIDELIDAIGTSKNEGLKATGGTNYEDAFKEAIDWFDDQPSDGYQNLAYFLTDGDPTYSNNGNTGSGSSTSYQVMKDAVDAFAELSDISTVRAIGIGNGVNENYLKFFDNTSVNGSGSVQFSTTETEMIADFTNGNSNGINSPDNWSKNGTGSLVQSSNQLRITDTSSNSGVYTVTSQQFDVENSGQFRFDYSTNNFTSSGFLTNGDKFTWQLQKLVNGVWTSDSGYSGERTSSSSTTISVNNVGSGTYRLIFSLEDRSGGWGASDAQVRIDNIRVEYPQTVTGPTGQVDIVTQPGQLTELLDSGNIDTEDLSGANDIVNGGAGDDILFGDNLSFAGIQGNGYTALQAYVAQQLGKPAGQVTAKDIHDYITANPDAFNLSRDNDGDDVLSGGTGNDLLFGQGGNDTLDGGDGNDTLYGGAGDDILIGGLGDDTFAWSLGDQGTTALPATDTIKDFGVGNDRLDLSDLLHGEEAPGADLTKFLHFETETQGGQTNTVIKVSTDGSLGSGGSNHNQEIVLENVDLVGSMVDQQAALIQSLIESGKLKIDQ